MRIGTFAFLVSCLFLLPAMASPDCPEWMTDGQCRNYTDALHTPVLPRIAPLTDSGGAGCMAESSAVMCGHAISRSQANWHWCPDTSRQTRCDLKWCEPNECWNTNCTVTTTVYCCASPERDQPPDWSTTEVTACPML